MYKTFVWIMAAGLVGAQTPQQPLQVLVVVGQGAINNARTHTGRDPVVEVRDESDQPVTGAVVTFQAPATGPSVTFGSGNGTLLTQTDSTGRATGRALRPNNVKGPFQIRVTASWNGRTASAVIAQTNAMPTEEKSSKKLWLIPVFGGAAAAGALVALRGKSSGGTAATSTPTNTNTGSIVPGTPGFGPPH